MLDRQVLLVTDDLELRHALRSLLEPVGTVLWERRGPKEAAQLAARRRFELVMLDLRSIDLGRGEATRALREHTKDALIALADPPVEALERAVFEAGADDLLPLPLEPGLLAKLRILASSGIHSWQRLGSGGRRPGTLELDPAAQELRCRGRAVHLTPTELKLLHTLSASPGRFVSQRRLLLELWGSSSLHRLEQLQMKMRQLRRKLDLLRQHLVIEPVLGYSLHFTVELVPA